MTRPPTPSVEALKAEQEERQRRRGIDYVRPVRIHRIIQEACTLLCVDIGELMGKNRHRAVVFCRMVIIAAARRSTTLSYPEIARAMGRPNHSTIVTAHGRMTPAYMARTVHGIIGYGSDFTVDQFVSLVITEARRV